MKKWYDVLLDEKVVTCFMILALSAVAVALIWHGADKEYIIPIFGSAITTLVGSLVRGTTHQAANDSGQSVSSTTTVTPKGEPPMQPAPAVDAAPKGS